MALTFHLKSNISCSFELPLQEHGWLNFSSAVLLEKMLVIACFQIGGRKNNLRLVLISVSRLLSKAEDSSDSMPSRALLMLKDGHVSFVTLSRRGFPQLGQ